MNSNFFHNLVNVVTLVLAGATAALLASGCVETSAGTISCEESFLSPSLSAIIITILMGLKLLVNIVRDGITGLTKKQPPVQ